MTRTSTHLLAGMAILGLSGVAQAADMGGPYRAPTVVQPIAEASSNGWYLRGDVGVGLTGSGKWSEGTIDAWNADPDFTGRAGWHSRSVGDTGTVGVGVGYQFNEYLRGDITAQYRANTRISGVNYIFADDGNWENKVSGKLRTGVFMANAYADLGNYSGLTPYVGAGLGAAYHRLSATDLGIGPDNDGATGRYTSAGNWQLAWALHTGLAYDLGRNLKLDVGYSYLNLGTAKTGVLKCNDPCGGTTPPKGLGVKDLFSHDLHIGVRYLLNPVERPVYAAPVVAKF